MASYNFKRAQQVVVHHFQHFLVHYTYTVNVQGIVAQQLVKFGGGCDRFHLKLVGLLTEFLPKTVQHHLGQRSPGRILLDLGRIQSDTLAFFVIAQILFSFGRIGGYFG